MAFNLARFWRFVDETAPNPTQGITRYKERKRARWVKPQEIPALVRAIDAQPNLYVRAALWLYLLTGVRKTELLCAKWDDVDFDQQVLTLPETKSGETQFAALNAPAVAILQSVPRLPSNPHILPGLKPGAHLIAISRGGILDEEALIDGLRSGRIAGAGLDVMAVEPLPTDSPLWDMDNVILSPHASALTAEMWEGRRQIFKENLRRFLADEPFLYVCDKQAGF